MPKINAGTVASVVVGLAAFGLLVNTFSTNSVVRKIKF